MKLQGFTFFVICICVFLTGAPNRVGAQQFDGCRAHAVCSSDGAGGWICDGPVQEVLFGSDQLQSVLQQSGCFDAQEVGRKDSWTIFMCAGEPGSRDILRKYEISQNRQSCDDGQQAAEQTPSPGVLGQVSQQEMDDIRQTAERVNREYEEQERRQQQAKRQADAEKQRRKDDMELQRRERQLLEQRLLAKQRRDKQARLATGPGAQGDKSDVMQAVEEVQRQIDEQRGGGRQSGPESQNIDESEMVRKALEEVMRKARQQQQANAPAADNILLEEAEEPAVEKPVIEEPVVEETARVKPTKGFSLAGQWRKTDNTDGEISVLPGGRATYMHPETSALSGEWEKLADNNYNIIWSRNPDGSPFSWEAINVIDRNLISVTNETRSTDGFKRTLATFYYLRVQN